MVLVCFCSFALVCLGFRVLLKFRVQGSTDGCML